MDPDGPRRAVADVEELGSPFRVEKIVAFLVPLLRFTGALASISEPIVPQIVSQGHYRTMLFDLSPMRPSNPPVLANPFTR